jgi:hypothetical protein
VARRWSHQSLAGRTRFGWATVRRTGLHSAHSGCAGPHLEVLNGDRTAPKLHLPLRAITSRDDAVDEDSIVAEKVGRFVRPPHHREVEVTVEYEGFHRAQSRSSIASDGRNKENAQGDEPLVRYEREPGCVALEIVPSHRAPPPTKPPATDPMLPRPQCAVTRARNTAPRVRRSALRPSVLPTWQAVCARFDAPMCCQGSTPGCWHTGDGPLVGARSSWASAVRRGWR